MSITPAVAFLDQDVPGWHRKINLETLNFCYATVCVAGQVYGSFCDEAFQEKLRRASLYGNGMFSARFADEWHHLIASRQEADAEIMADEPALELVA